MIINLCYICFFYIFVEDEKKQIDNELMDDSKDDEYKDDKYEELRRQIEELDVKLKQSCKKIGDLKGENVNGMSFNELSELEQILFNSLRIVRKKMNEKQSSYQLCRVCLDQNKNVVLRPCNHMAICKDCSVRIRQCPICQADIMERIIVYI